MMPTHPISDPLPQLDRFSALQSSIEGIDTEFKSACGGMSAARMLITSESGSSEKTHINQTLAIT